MAPITNAYPVLPHIDNKELLIHSDHAISDTQRPGVRDSGFEFFGSHFIFVPVARLGTRGSNMTHRS